MANSYIVLLPCAGNGSRVKSKVPKQYIKINGKTILEYTLDAFLATPQINQIVIITAPDDDYIDAILTNYQLTKIEVMKVGGSSRAISVKNGLNKLNCTENDWVMVHDAARCCILPQTIRRMIEILNSDEVGGILAIPAIDTVKQGDGQVISKTLDRRMIYLAQTPQMFRYKVLKTAYNEVNVSEATDDAALVEKTGLEVKLVLGEPTNIKITYKEDFDLATMILSKQYVTPQK